MARTIPEAPIADTDFNDLYDISEGEEEVADIPISITVPDSPLASRQRKHLAQLMIPDPAAWPTVQSRQKVDTPLIAQTELLTPFLTAPRTELSRIANRSSTHSSSSHTPSLDGSVTSEECSGPSCPATPEITSATEDDPEWNVPVQLNPSSLMALDRIANATEQDSQLFTIQPREMEQRGPPLMSFGSTFETRLAQLNTGFDFALAPIENGELSALSLPSPGGFFASQEVDTRLTWRTARTASSNLLPLTSTAESFYNPAYQDQGQVSPDTPRGPNLDMIEYSDGTLTEGPPTARYNPSPFAGSDGADSERPPEGTGQFQEYKERYTEQLQEQSTANLDRTATWLAQQVPLAEAKVEKAKVERAAAESKEKDATFLRGVQHLKNSTNPKDPFVHRKTRTEKLRLDRKCLFSSHIDQLVGTCHATRDGRPAALQSEDKDSEAPTESALIAGAIREQEALDHIKPLSWNVEATKYLNGGTLLTSPTGKTFKINRNGGSGEAGRVLDLGGIATADWAWQVALEHPRVSVHTVCAPGAPLNADIARPRNHRQVEAPNLWTLPFPANHFDCISARSLHALLRPVRPPATRGPQRLLDEFDLCLRECYRVLRPGGCLEFALMDADVMGGGRLARAFNAAFAADLAACEYDAVPTRRWLARLRRAGFGGVRRAWLVLPVSGFGDARARAGSTADASHITGMVGGWAWERWVLKVNREMGRSDARLLDGVAGVMDEGAKTGASWRYLSGYARKPY
jgi:SAM-dependent methyltransferase